MAVNHVRRVGKLARWRIRLSEFDSEVVYRASVKHWAVDALSRLQRKGAVETELDDDVPVLELSSESFYTVVSTDTAKLTEERGTDSSIESTAYLPEVFVLANQISEEERDALNLYDFIQVQTMDHECQSSTETVGKPNFTFFSCTWRLSSSIRY